MPPPPVGGPISAEFPLGAEGAGNFLTHFLQNLPFQACLAGLCWGPPEPPPPPPGGVPKVLGWAPPNSPPRPGLKISLLPTRQINALDWEEIAGLACWVDLGAQFSVALLPSAFATPRC